jgi:hypothetical protein
MVSQGTRLLELTQIESAVWDELAAAAEVPAHEWRVGVLATTDGHVGLGRSVVLRGLDREARELVFYTDSRSPKAQQIAAHPRGTLVFWSRTRGWQLRVRLTLAVEVEGLAVSSRWATLKMTPAAQDYLSPLAPGSPIEHPAPERGTRDHFALVRGEIESIDWLELGEAGQRRALFDRSGARWLQP